MEKPAPNPDRWPVDRHLWERHRPADQAMADYLSGTEAAVLQEQLASVMAGRGHKCQASSAQTRLR
jgi:hypothetical protein